MHSHVLYAANESYFIHTLMPISVIWCHCATCIGFNMGGGEDIKDRSSKNFAIKFRFVSWVLNLNLSLHHFFPPLSRRITLERVQSRKHATSLVATKSSFTPPLQASRALNICIARKLLKRTADCLRAIPESIKRSRCLVHTRSFV